MSDLLCAVEELYMGVVSDPEQWNEQRFVDWSESVAGGAIDRAGAKYLRRIVRVAQKLQAFWSSSTDRPDLDWRSKVDIVLGPSAWRPVLGLASHVMTADPSQELFETTAVLFRLVNNDEYLDGIDFEEWMLGRTRADES